ncbi:MAG: ribosome maturation factor RimM [Anaerolineae bacterium]
MASDAAEERSHLSRPRRSGERPVRKVPCYLVVGKVVAPWGTRGELKVAILTDFPDRFRELKRVYLGDEPWMVEGHRRHGKWVILKLEGCADRNSAEKLRGALVRVPLEEAVPLSEDEYYIYQIVGLEVWTSRGEHLGRVSEVLFTGANEVYVVEGERGQILVPAIEDVIKEVDLEGGRLIVEPLEGIF